MTQTTDTSKRKWRKNEQPVIPLEFQGKIPPHARELEEAVLGAMMLQRDCIDEVLLNLQSDQDFYVLENQYIFRSIQRLHAEGKQVDLLTINNDLRNKNELELAGGSHYLAQLSNRVASAANVVFHSQIVRQKSIQRAGIRACGEWMNVFFDEDQDPFEAVDGMILDLESAKEITGAKRMMVADTVGETVKELQDTASSKFDGGVTGLDTGFKIFNEFFGGWQPGDLILMAARPSHGKTALALNTMEYSGKPVGIFSLEMSKTQLNRRLLSNQADVPNEGFNTGKIAPNEFDRLLKAKGYYEQRAHIMVDDTANIDIMALKSNARLWKRKYGLELLVVDYIQLMRCKSKDHNREQEISTISRELKGLAKELNIPIIALAQLSREVEKRADKMPMLADLRESGSLEQDADVVIFLMRPEMYNLDGKQHTVDFQGQQLDIVGFCHVNIAKNRQGAVGGGILQYHGSRTRFTDHPFAK